MTQARALQSLLRAVKPLAASMSINEVADLFLAAEHRAFLSLPVVDENNRPLGLVSRATLQDIFMQRFGRDLRGRHPVGEVMNDAPLIVSVEASLEEASKQVTAQLQYPITEDFVLIDAQGGYCGLGTVLDLLKAMEARVAQRNRVLRQALVDLKESQAQLLQSEKMASLGQMVAGVAHEVNNPIGISLTVASSFARRSEIFESDLRTEPLRRSKLDEFVRASRDASQQLVANLQRAGELIQSFKQVAVDRSHAERRQFALSEATDQIVASLRPVLKKAAIALSVDVPEGLLIDGYPGAYGQILTNLFLNAVNHAFADGRSGNITISARGRGADDVEIIFADDGAGMTPDVQRQAFDPFFTTRRNEGGTGLGLHIVYNLVTQQLGGRMMLESRVGQGTTFRIIMPRIAKGAAMGAAEGEPTITDAAADGTSQWPNRTMSSN